MLGVSLTKVLLHFRLPSPLSAAHLERLAELRGVYGILRFDHEPASLSFDVEYDATRLCADEVANLLRRNGLPVLPALPA